MRRRPAKKRNRYNKIMVTLSKGGSLERQINVNCIVIPDLWHIAQQQPEPAKSMILECWRLAHDMHRHIIENY